MNKNDLCWLGFITLWIVLCAGKPDLLDALTFKVMGSQCTYDAYKGAIK